MPFDPESLTSLNPGLAHLQKNLHTFELGFSRVKISPELGEKISLCLGQFSHLQRLSLCFANNYLDPIAAAAEIISGVPVKLKDFNLEMTLNPISVELEKSLVKKIASLQNLEKLRILVFDIDQNKYQLNESKIFEVLQGLPLLKELHYDHSNRRSLIGGLYHLQNLDLLNLNLNNNQLELLELQKILVQLCQLKKNLVLLLHLEYNHLEYTDILLLFNQLAQFSSVDLKLDGNYISDN